MLLAVDSGDKHGEMTNVLHNCSKFFMRYINVCHIKTTLLPVHYLFERQDHNHHRPDILLMSCLSDGLGYQVF